LVSDYWRKFLTILGGLLYFYKRGLDIYVTKIVYFLLYDTIVIKNTIFASILPYMNTDESIKELVKSMSAISAEQFIEFLEVIKDKKYYLKDSGVAPRIYNYWKKLQIEPPEERNIPEGKNRLWVLLDFAGFVWLKLLDDLRLLGYPTEHIKKIKDKLFSNYGYEQVKQLQKSKPDFVNKYINTIVNDNAPPEVKEAVQKLYADEKYFKKMEANIFSQINLWNLLIIVAIINKQEEYGLRIFRDGDFIIYQHSLFASDVMGYSNETMQSLFRETHIYMSITNYILDFVSSEEKKEYMPRLNIFTKVEENLLRIFRSNEYKKITLHYDKGTGTKIIKTEKEKKVNKEKIVEFMKDVVFNAYCKYSYTPTKKGDLIVNIEKTEKI
jgi:hypothetical protein